MSIVTLYDVIEAYLAQRGWTTVRDEDGQTYWVPPDGDPEDDGYDFTDAIDAQDTLDESEGPGPVERRRCVTHDCEVRDDSDECWRAEGWIVVGPCRFVTEYAVPAPSRPEPPEEAPT